MQNCNSKFPLIIGKRLTENGILIVIRGAVPIPRFRMCLTLYVGVWMLTQTNFELE